MNPLAGSVTGGEKKGMDGVLVIDKPAGPTSHDVVNSIRKILKEKKVGHTGTLDPAATGVLPLVLGKATKVARYLTGSNKRYHATVRLGANTDTLDREGQILKERDVRTDEASVREVLLKFLGDIEQTPPMFSAKKVEGKRLYELARKGVEVERDAKQVTIHSIELLACELPNITIDVRCSVGTYLRVLAEDIGEALDCGGYLLELRRTAAGPFTVEEAVPLDEVANNPEVARARLVTLDRALVELPRINVPPSIARMIASGHQLNVADLRTLDTPDFAKDDPITIGLDGGELIAIVRSLVASADLPTCRRDRRALKTERVIAPPGRT